ncbi:MAG: Uma2 family endonuclease [Planctomycetes bacterium]|nr:Uma2 family endonuclease [Planctomycetota bacterium]
MDGRRVLPEQAVVYPTRDGKPMGETDDHRDEMKDYGINVLKDRYQGEPQVYVSGNNFIYPTEGVSADSISPDVYVVKGVPDRQRDVYKVWEEGGHLPCFVLEVTSRSTRLEDLGAKMAKYRDDLGVKEYFLFDPRGEWIPGRLRGFVLEGGVYQPIQALASGRLPSHELGLELGVVAGHLRFFEPGAAEPLPTRAERAEREARRADAERKRAETEHRRAETERLRAEAERLRAEAEHRRAEAAEQEVRRLRAELERLKGGPRAPGDDPA